MTDTLTTPHATDAALTAIANHTAAVRHALSLQSMRDDLVLAAIRAGVSYGELARLAGVAKGSVQSMASRALEREKDERVSAWGVEQ